MIMIMKKFSLCLVGLFSLCVLNSAMAADKSYVVYLRRDSVLGSSTEELGGDEMSHTYHDLLASCMESKEKAKEAIFYSYSGIINGFTATLEDDEVEQLERHRQVLQVLPNQEYQLHTTRSWAFMGLEDSRGIVPPNSLWRKTNYGKYVIIANLDTGVWPESPFFNDEGYGPVPSRWKGTCDAAGGFKCNRKLIGARAFHNGRPGTSPRDVNGHGTHTLSTAGGTFVSKTGFLGSANGTGKGGSPKARVAAYRVCDANAKCLGADVLAGFDAAIRDGVDVISMSLGTSTPVGYSRDSFAIGAFHAVRRGITVVCSAGNSGSDGSVTNVAPWIITVAASTLDRRFVSDAVVGNGKRYKGISFRTNTLPSKKFYRLVNSVNVKSPSASTT